MATTAQERVTIVEVGPRDGLQNEARPISTAAKLQFIRALAAAGLRRIEASSFVSPRAIPQLGDAAELFAALFAAPLPPGLELSALVPNEKGLERAIAAGVQTLAVFTASSEAFNQHNIGCGIDESFRRFEPIFARARGLGLRVRGYISTVFGCPYQGAVPLEATRDLALRLLAAGCFEVSLGDTIGVATPSQVGAALTRTILPATGVGPIALHFHDTRGTALANVVEGLRLGVRVFDASAGGLGGCPYAPGAAGNLATEDLLYLLAGMGYDTGVCIEEVARAALALEPELGHPLPGRTVATFRGRCHTTS